MISRRAVLQHTAGLLVLPILSNVDTTTRSFEPVALWDLLSTDYRKNCLAWRHSEKNPVIPATGKGWTKVWTANPDFLNYKGKQLLFYRGHGTLTDSDKDNHDRIGLAEVADTSAHAIALRPLNNNRPIINNGEPGAFDAYHALDPASVIFKDEIFVYYSAIGPGPDSVGMARSRDGVTFTKHGKIMDGRAPDLIVKDGRLYMTYQVKREKKGSDSANAAGYELFLAVSDDGIRFERVVPEPILRPDPGKWDNQCISTGRLFTQGNYHYLLYGSSFQLEDQPDYFGLARSKDLVNWERHSGNPIFGCGAKGTPDGGAIWFPALLEEPDRYVLLYEGSRGKYGWELSSEICMATLPKRQVQ